VRGREKTKGSIKKDEKGAEKVKGELGLIDTPSTISLQPQQEKREEKEVSRPRAKEEDVGMPEKNRLGWQKEKELAPRIQILQTWEEGG